ncbi:MAG: response regulator [Candidatus Glassbacteria bacterium]|nr:response regulator [Candidatus Glassbacteria bacterium]
MSDKRQPPDSFVPADREWDSEFLDDVFSTSGSIEDEALKLARSLANLTDCDRVRPLKELAQIGSLESIENIYPFCHRGSSFLRRLARNAVVKIILRTLRDDEEEKLLGLKQKDELLEFLLQQSKQLGALRTMELSDPEIRRTVYDILIGDDREFTAGALVDIVRDSDECVRATAVKLIAEMMGEQETALLVRLLSDNDPRVKANVIESLGTLGDRNVVSLLRKYRQDKNNRIKATTLKTLWELNHREIMPYLEDMVVELDPEVRSSAAWVIGEIGHGQKQFKDLLRLLEKDPDKSVRRNVTLAREKIEMKEQGVRILLASSDLPNCRKISYNFSLEGYHTEIATNGEDALAEAQEHRPQVLVIDIRLPGVNGLEVVRRLREQKWFESATVIVCTDFESHPLVDRAIRTGANTYIVKPCTFEKIKSKLRYFL